MLIVLVGLGTWLVDRLAWKQAILRQIDAAEARPPEALTDRPSPFARVRVAGHFRPESGALFGAEVRTLPSGPVMGARLIGVLERPGATPILVDRGWVPLKGSRPPPVASEVTVVGYVRPAEVAGWFAAADEPSNRRFHTWNPAVIAGALGLAAVEPYVLVAVGPAPPGQWPDPAKHLPRPPNNHLIYALTWYGFALTLVVIFLVWARRTLRS
jgi:surfeit locus 1 family protein